MIRKNYKNNKSKRIKIRVNNKKNNIKKYNKNHKKPNRPLKST